jgi:hypothetical protein
MSDEWIIGGLLAVFWGGLWASVLQFTAWGKWAAVKRTWLTVVVGTAGTLAAALAAVDWITALGFLWLFAMAGLPIILRSLINEWSEDK